MSTVTRAKFGWCLDGHHATCPREVLGISRALRCDCPCHQEAPK